MFFNGYQCIACAETQPASFTGFLCPTCGNNLELTYDYAAVAHELAGGFGAGRRDIFRYQALLPLTPEKHAFPLRIGGTPLYRAARLGEQAGVPGLYLKDDSCNPSASFKDRASAVVLRRAKDLGASVVATASTGNAGASLACLAAAMGLQSVILIPEKAPLAKLSQALAFGARVLAVRGSYDDAFDLCLTASEEFGWFNRSTGFNPFTREGKKTCAFELWEDLGKQVPDRVVVPSGDGNILSGIWKGWRELRSAGLIEKMPKLDCAQSESSAAISRTVQRLRSSAESEPDWSQVRVDQVHASTIADSISVNQPRDGLAAVQAVFHSGGEAVTVPDQEILIAMREMAHYSGVFPEPAAATTWAAVKKLSRNGQIRPDEVVVCLVTGSGLKDSARVLEVSDTPQPVDPDIEAIRTALNQQVLKHGPGA
jgi:threonine synthase